MDNNLIEKYKQEMLNMQQKSKSLTEEMPQIEPPIIRKPTSNDSEGRLLANVTAIRRLYPVPNAKVTIFEGDLDNMQILDIAFTDDSGKTREFILPTPKKSLSLDSANTQLPYSLYGMMVQADGYIDNVHLNIPVFSGVTSIQGSDMMLVETAGIDKGPQIYDELQQFTL